jgi:hypothetical protein
VKAPDVIKEVDALPECDELGEGQLAIRIGCAACPSAVNLVATAEAGEFLASLRKTDVPYNIKGNIEGNGVGWRKSGTRECFTASESCVLEEHGERQVDLVTLAQNTAETIEA